MTYFISGHRNVSEEEFNEHYAPKIDKGISTQSVFVVGDYDGVDLMAQQYLHEKNYHKVTVYHMLEAPRVNIGFIMLGGFKSDEDRDSAMTKDSDEDIAWVRKGKEGSGTALNLVRRSVYQLIRACQEHQESPNGFRLTTKHYTIFETIKRQLREEWKDASKERCESE